MNQRSVAVVLVDRANYGRIRPVMHAIDAHPGLRLQTVVAGSMLLERFGLPIETVVRDGFQVDAEVHIEMEGSYPITMAKSVGIGVIEFASALSHLKPDLVLLIGDRYEALAATIAAVYQNIPVAHIQGGEVSGSVDESARHAISKFSQFHFPSTKRAADYLVRMGEDPGCVFLSGCPSGDLIRSLDRSLPEDVFEQGIGAPLNPDDPFLLVILHPVTTRYGAEEGEADALLSALEELAHPTIWLWPNIDAGSDHISRALRRHREHHDAHWLRLVKGFPPEVFERVLGSAQVAVGNSSSFVRDASFLGTPVVLMGDRQRGREVAENVVGVGTERGAILKACRHQLEAGRYPPSSLYGDGRASPRIADALASADLYVQKVLHYTEES